MHSMASLSATARFAIHRSCTLVACFLMLAVVANVCAAPPAQRQLAPGVITTIPPDFNPEETVSTHDLIEIRSDSKLEWKPEFMAVSDTLYGMAEQAKFRRAIYCLEFAFKPLRMIEVD